jgi:dephospho-CoA kinase
MAPTRVIGLTGGIGSGKSTVAAMLRAIGHPVVDADELAREVVKPGQPAYEDIVARFGKGVLAANGELDRPTLAARVFADSEARRALNAITHPRVAQAAAAAMGRYRAEGAPLVFYEVPLLVENRLHELPGLLDAVCVVAVPEDEQVRRATSRGQPPLDEAEVRRRIAAQAPLSVKIAAADYVIDNVGSTDDTRAQVDLMVTDLLAGGPAKRKR